VDTSQANLDQNGQETRLRETQDKMKLILKTKEENKHKSNWPSILHSRVATLLILDDFKTGNFEPMESLKKKLADLVKRETELGIHDFALLQKQMDTFTDALRIQKERERLSEEEELRIQKERERRSEEDELRIQKERERADAYLAIRVHVSGAYEEPLQRAKPKRKRKAKSKL